MTVLEAPLMMEFGIKAFLFMLIAILCIKTKITTVPLYIIAGLLISGLMTEVGILHGVAEVGIVLLFFLLGLEYPLDKMLSIARRISFGGILDVVLNMGVTVGIVLLFGFELPTAILIGGVTYASSSSITLKMLEEKKRLANPESDYMIALLIFEDIVAPLLVTLITVLHLEEEFTLAFTGSLLLRVILMLVLAVLLSKYVFRRFRVYLKQYRNNDDIIILFAVAVALGFAGLALYFELSELLGAFLAGVVLAELRETEKIEDLVMPIRQVTLPFFFLWFGTSISVGEGFFALPLMAILLIWAILGKIIVGYIGGQFFGLSPRFALRAGISLVQRGEFSVVIAAVAVPAVRSFSGIYILISAFIGMLFFNKAVEWSVLWGRQIELLKMKIKQE